MNIISTLVGLSIAGATAPLLMDMSLAPVIAQKKANNFAIAESSTATYQAQNQTKTSIDDLTDPTDGCNRSNEGLAVSISCNVGTGKFIQTSKRSFVLTPPSASPGGGELIPSRTFVYPPPPGFTSIECFAREDWGINTSAFNRSTNTWNGPSCMPNILRGNTGTRYRGSEISSWRYDINNHNGFGVHRQYYAE